MKKKSLVFFYFSFSLVHPSLIWAISETPFKTTQEGTTKELNLPSIRRTLLYFAKFQLLVVVNSQ